MQYGEPCSSECTAITFETVDQLKQAIVDEWCALSQKLRFVILTSLNITQMISDILRSSSIAVSMNGEDI